MTTITTATDLATWLGNTNPENYLSLPNAPAVQKALVEALRAGDHPAWGSDWSSYLDTFDYSSAIDTVS